MPNEPAGLENLHVTVMEARVTHDTSSKNWRTTVFESWEDLPEIHPASFGDEVARQDNALRLRDLVSDLCHSRTRIREINDPYTDFASGQTAPSTSIMRKITVLLQFAEHTASPVVPTAGTAP